MTGRTCEFRWFGAQCIKSHAHGYDHVLRSIDLVIGNADLALLTKSKLSVVDGHIFIDDDRD